MPSNRTRDKIELYVLSLWLLFVLLFILTVDIPVCFGGECRFIGYRALAQRNVVPLIALALIGLSVLYFFRFKHKIAGSPSIPAKATQVEDVSYEHLTFLATYIIPLAGFDLTSVRYLIVLGVLLVAVGAIYVKTDKFYVNPTLALLGFRLYSLTIAHRAGVISATVVTREPIGEGDMIRYLEIDSRVYFARVGS
jgi:hypothetical protein